MQAAAVDALTINEAADTTGWSARMLRYIESIGLVEPRRSSSGYRLYGPPELQRLSTLRELLEGHGLDLSEVGFALRLQAEPELRKAVEQWLSAEPERPAHVAAADWLRFEQQKHQRLLNATVHLARRDGSGERDQAAHADRGHRASAVDDEDRRIAPTTMETA
jgi:MerR family transcriptional regulator, copper efflux regulator